MGLSDLRPCERKKNILFHVAETFRVEFFRRVA